MFKYLIGNGMVWCFAKAADARQGVPPESGENGAADTGATGTADGVLPPLMADAVQTGFPSPAEHYIERELDLNDYLSAHRDATYYVRVTGESMTGANIFPGDVLCVDRSLDFFDGAIVVASVDGEFTVKYLRKNGKTTYLEPANPRFPSIRFSPAQDIRFWGVVTGVVRKINYGGHRRSVPEPELRPAQSVSVRNAGIRIKGTREKYKQKLGGQ